jgi:hypothetical protein
MEMAVRTALFLNFTGMKIVIFLFACLLFLSCKKTDESVVKLLRSEAAGYPGILQVTKYIYDANNRIIAIQQLPNNASVVDTFTFTYNGNEIIMRNNPKGDPFYKKTNEVHLTVNANGKLVKRIGFTFSVGASPNDSARKEFVYDTLVNTFDAAGYLKETKQTIFDSVSAAPGSSAVSLVNTAYSYTTLAGNITAEDRYTSYTVVSFIAGNTVHSSGTFESYAVFNYSKMYPNKTDFRNTAALNELEDYSSRTLLDEQYKNMPDQIVTHTIERNGSGTITFEYTGTENVERIYNNDNGWLSDVNVLTATTQYPKIRYFYGR